MDHGVKFQCVYFGYPFPKKQFLFTSSVTPYGVSFKNLKFEFIRFLFVRSNFEK